MDNKAPCKEVSEELFRELLIGISNSLPEKVAELNSVAESCKSVDSFVASNGEEPENYRSELISISYEQTTDVKV